MTAKEGGLRFADILTTAAAVADYMGVPDVSGDHVLAAINILLEERQLEDMGRPVSPMLRRHGQEKGVEPGVRELVQRWFARLDGDVNAKLDTTLLAEFKQDITDTTGGTGN
jgi:hypothetical protein